MWSASGRLPSVLEVEMKQSCVSGQRPRYTQTKTSGMTLLFGQVHVYTIRRTNICRARFIPEPHYDAVGLAG